LVMQRSRLDSRDIHLQCSNQCMNDRTRPSRSSARPYGSQIEHPLVELVRKSFVNASHIPRCKARITTTSSSYSHLPPPPPPTTAARSSVLLRGTRLTCTSCSASYCHPNARACHYEMRYSSRPLQT